MRTKAGGARSARARKRLAPEDWIEAAIQALLTDGGRGLRIAALAKRLGVTPGSFYWHFKDRDALRDRVIQHWMNEMLRLSAAQAERSGPGIDQLRALPRILLSKKLPLFDGAMRRWALDDEVVARAVARADELRVRVVAGMLEASGLEARAAERRAKLVVWAFRGSLGVDEKERMRAMTDLIEALLHDV